MAFAVSDNLLDSFEPRDIPGLVCFWHFGESADHFPARQGRPYALHSRSGVLDVVSDPHAPLGGSALELEEGQWLSIPRSECPELDIHGPGGHVTVVAWIKRKKTASTHCEFIAGQWNESNRGRQYGLFLNIGVWGFDDCLCGHVSNTGGPSPGYRYCMDGCFGATEIPCDTWCVVGMSYDGFAARGWIDGRLDARPGLNPYPLAGGLHDGGVNGSDFTVGAVDRSHEIGNFFRGCIAALAVYRRALTPAEFYALSNRP